MVKGKEAIAPIKHLFVIIELLSITDSNGFPNKKFKDGFQN